MLKSEGLPSARDVPQPVARKCFKCHVCDFCAEKIPSLDAHVRARHATRVFESRALLARHVATWRPIVVAFHVPQVPPHTQEAVSYTHLRAHETGAYL
eukprot:7223657-Pyramimonas_sp.AAC.2